MSANASTDGLLLPPRARLLHIGLMKTGTTGLQNAASSLREPLLAAGVRYPGNGLNHRTALTAVMGRGWGWNSTPQPEAWRDLKAEIEAEESRRVWVGHEFVSECDDDLARRFRDELGDRTHVVVTLRNYAAVLPSAWQQTMKGGRTRPFESWLKGVLSDAPKLESTRRAQERLDQGAIVQRWASVFGPDKVTVVVVDKSTPELLFDAFESMLGLDRGMLSQAELDGYASNRSMSVEEAELLRAVNHELRGQLSWTEYRWWLRLGVAGHMLGERSPGEHDTRIVLPTWAAEKAAKRSARFVEQISSSGARVVGDLDLLDRPVPHEERPVLDSPTVPVDAAARAVLGAIAQGRLGVERAGRHGVPHVEPVDTRDMLDGASTQDLVAALTRKLRSRAGGLVGRHGATSTEDNSA
ncbi:hypothetical protein ATJ88_2795 [Isoptericola jiangsuensis]|uniref:Sulfotransferase family protein n=1 Tax=Isoptericola jiangsuensis TaxID=548579 RepID=A0A2A9EY50_9MICO|nr:hypothetical protein [Isoptericola jiangsuensis]PFG44077.1 hypothetical protein ATJ88_2795 [Isoptericola jiangsuensis]